MGKRKGSKSKARQGKARQSEERCAEVSAANTGSLMDLLSQQVPKEVQGMIATFQRQRQIEVSFATELTANTCPIMPPGGAFLCRS